MKKMKWILIPLLALMAGCTQTQNEGLTPSQPVTGYAYFPNPLVLFNGQFAAQVGVASKNTVDLANYCPGYSYDAVVTLFAGDTSVTPIRGNGNFLFGVSTYSKSGNGCANFADLPVYPLDSAGNTTTVNLTPGSYTQATFYAMEQGFSTSTQTVAFNAAGGAGSFPLTSSWSPCTITLGSLSAVNVLFEINVAAPTEVPVTIYVDQLQYQ